MITQSCDWSIIINTIWRLSWSSSCEIDLYFTFRHKGSGLSIRMIIMHMDWCEDWTLACMYVVYYPAKGFHLCLRLLILYYANPIIGPFRFTSARWPRSRGAIPKLWHFPAFPAYRMHTLTRRGSRAQPERHANAAVRAELFIGTHLISS